MNLLIKHKIWIGFALLLFILLILASLSIIKFKETKVTVSSVVVDSQPMLTAAQNFSSYLSHAHGAIGEFLLTREDKNRQDFQNLLYEANESLNEMANLPIIQTTPMYQQHIDNFKEGLSHYQSFEPQIIALSKNSTKNLPATSFALEKMSPLVQTVLSVIGQMILSEEEEELSSERVVWLNVIQDVRYSMQKFVSTLRIYLNNPSDSSKENMLGEAENILALAEIMKSDKFVDLYTFEEEEGVPEIYDAIVEYIKHTERLIELNSSPKRRMDIYLYKSQMAPAKAKIQNELDELVSHLLSENASKSTELLDHVDNASVIQMTLAVIGIILGIIVALVISRLVTLPLIATVEALQDLAQGNGDLTQRLPVNNIDEIGQLSAAFNDFAQKVQALVQDASNCSLQLARSASEMDATAGSTQSDVAAQSQQIDTIASAITEMTHKIQDVVRHTTQAANLAEETSNHAQSGQTVVNQSVTSSQQLAQNVDQASLVINELENDVTAISGVLDVIRSIAEQTNLLALNAAIEAARAGEQGRGFAVVADEVRTLASRTGESTDEIQKMIERLQNGSHQAVQVMEQGKEKATEGLDHAKNAGEALNKISTAVSGMRDMNREVAEATEYQGNNVSQVSESVATLKGVSDHTADSANTMASTSNQVTQLAQQLQSILGQFKI
ncbi:MAG: methyl-accepting chemotaxis protein [Gammaproteobacteria bacterium]|nr:methyl-accepting chemotaxis protein [Gammaproteobacteria bacterium]